MIHRAAAGLFVGLLIGWPGTARAQMSMAGAGASRTQAPGAAASPVEGPRVTVGELTGVAGGSVLLPLSWTPDPKMPSPLQRLTVELTFVSNLITFETALAGAPEPNDDLDVQSRLEAGAPDDQGVIRSTLRVTVAPPVGQTARALPSGLLAFLIFRISTEAKMTVVPLHVSLVSAEDVKNAPLQVAKVSVQSGKIAIETAGMEVPMGTCFFYMH